MMDEGVDRIKATYRDNYDRLVEIKWKYDPANFSTVTKISRPTKQKEMDVGDRLPVDCGCDKSR